MKKYIIIIVLWSTTTLVFGQVQNGAWIYAKPGTQVQVFENLTNTSSGSMTMDQEALLFVQGTLVNDGVVTFEDAASLLRGSTGNDGTGSGTYFVKRQGTNNGTVYNYWSSPMTSYGSVPGNNPYLYNSDLSTQGFGDDQPIDPGWLSYNSNMIPGVGYIGRGAGLYSFSGDVNNGNINVPMAYYPYAPGNTNPGTPFNLCGNPYPSAISCASLVAANPDVNGSIYFWDDDLSGGSGYTSSDYAVWNGTGSLGTGAGTVGAPNGYIGTAQAFMIRSLNNGAVLNFTNNMRVAQSNTQFFRMDGSDSRLWFSIEGDDLFNQILIGVLADATDNEDRLYDAVKIRGNTNVTLAAIDNSREYAILAFPPPNAGKIVPLSVFVSEAGVYRFHANAMEGFTDVDVYFSDTQNGTYQLLQEGTQIEVSLSEGEHEERFYLNFTGGLVTGIDEPAASLSAYVYQDNLHLQLNATKSNVVSLQLIDMQGRLILERTNLQLSEAKATISLFGISTGIYVARVIVEGLPFSKKVLKN